MPTTTEAYGYNSKLSADDQISMEEGVAALLFEQTDVSEEQCADLGREILLTVLKKFRPDLLLVK